MCDGTNAARARQIKCIWIDSHLRKHFLELQVAKYYAKWLHPAVEKIGPREKSLLPEVPNKHHKSNSAVRIWTAHPDFATKDQLPPYQIK